MTGPRILVLTALLATLVAVGVVVATTGDEGDAEPSASTNAERTEGEAGGPGTRGDDEEDGDGDGPQKSGYGQAGSDSSPDGQPVTGQTGDDFEARLSSIIAGSLAELTPLAQGTAAAGDPETYAKMLATGAAQMEGTIDELEALDAPPAAEEGVEDYVDAYDEFDEAVSRGSKDFSSGKRAKIDAALGYLEVGAAEFRSDLAAATQTLADAGFSAPSIR